MPVDVSVTVAVHVTLDPANTTEGVQLIVVVLARPVTVTVAVPELPAWVASPP